jgi:FMN-dependent oxidoreductase (nitrilotriacetate monooxygenase family)
MSSPQRQLHFNAFLMSSGHHEAAWRLPESNPFANTDLGHWRDLAQIAERGTFDSLFLADGPAVRANPEFRPAGALEPTILLTALAAATSHIGLIATASTTYNAPYNLARRFASLDHVSGGRAGWNIVTSARSNEAYNFGRDAHYEHEERYDRAREFTNVVLGLWDSWDDDAFIRDKASGLFFDPGKLHVLNHKGENFSVRGPLNVPRSPQGYPVLVQAGSSDTGRGLASEFGEAIFTAYLTLGESQEFYADLKGRASNLGRNPEHIKILPGLSFMVGRTAAEAQEKYDELQSLIHPMVARELVSMTLGGVDLSAYPMDGPMPELAPTNSGSQSAFATTMKLARDENLTIRQLGMRLAAGRQRHHVTGTPEHIVDVMEEWFTHGAADGFNILPPYLPGALNDFVDLVIPELRRRGLFRTEYEGATLRENLGLPRPSGRYAKQRAELT